MTAPMFFSQTAVERFHLIRPFLEDNIPLTRLAVAEGISERTLRRWVTRYRKQGLNGLERQSRSDRGKRRRIASELEAWIKARALQKPRPLMTAIHREVLAMAVEKSLVPPSYAVVSDIVRALDPALLTLATEGPAAYRNHYELVHRREADAPNAIWQADHTLLDIELLNERQEPQRPWLTVIIDDYSRAISGYFLSFDAPCSVRTALALRQAIWHKESPQWPVCGLPEILYADHGTDFISQHIEQACISLKIRLIHSRIGRPRGRGRIERLFRTVNQTLLADLPGHTIKGKPVSLAALDLSGFDAQFERFLHERYHRHPHGGTGQPPLQRWQAGGFLPMLPESRQQLDLLLLHANQSRKVHCDGIRFHARRYIDPTLAAFVGEQVHILYDPRDVAEIAVYYENQFVCRAICQELAAQSLTLEEIRKARRTVREERQQDIKEAKTLLAGQTAAEPDPGTRRGRPRLKRYAND
jgi:putative transposase